MRGPKKVAPAARPAPHHMPAVSRRALAASATLTFIPARYQHHHALRPGHTQLQRPQQQQPGPTTIYVLRLPACVARSANKACVVQADRLDIGVAHNV